MKKSFLSGYAVPEWLADACARECARGFCGHAVLSVRQLEFLLALAQGAAEMIQQGDIDMPRIFKHLTRTDRLRIEKCLNEGYTYRQIADVLRVHISTVYR